MIASSTEPLAHQYCNFLSQYCSQENIRFGSTSPEHYKPGTHLYIFDETHLNEKTHFLLGWRSERLISWLYLASPQGQNQLLCYYLSDSVNFPFGRKPEYPEKALDFSKPRKSILTPMFVLNLVIFVARLFKL